MPEDVVVHIHRREMLKSDIFLIWEADRELQI
jgi:hypothetical protein